MSATRYEAAAAAAVAACDQQHIQCSSYIFIYIYSWLHSSHLDNLAAVVVVSQASAADNKLGAYLQRCKDVTTREESFRGDVIASERASKLALIVRQMHARAHAMICR